MGKILTAMILSADGFGIGASYGLRGMKINKKSYAAIFLISFVIFKVSVFIGEFLVNILSEDTASFIGSGVLISMGLYIIIQNLKEIKKESERQAKCTPIAIEAIKNPFACDINKSKSIEVFEALYLTIALSIDSFGVGIGIASLYENINILPFLMAAFQIGFLYAGYAAGKKFKIKKRKINAEKFIPGVILVIIGIFRIIIK